MQNPLIGLMTDFGLEDFFVPSVKAVIHSINKAARIIDITHSIPSYDVRAAGFILAGCCSFFPKGTVFLSVVDPGVGSSRKILLAHTDKYDFIAPDNGLLTLALQGVAGLELRSVSNPKYFLSRSSRTFEGRDIMAPAAAWLSIGAPLSEFGPRLDDYRRFPDRSPRLVKGVIKGEVVYVDKFGNLITNIPSALLKEIKPGTIRELRLKVKGRAIGSFQESYSRGRPGKPFGLIGSLDTVEISLREASAAARLQAGPGDEVQVAAD